MRSCSTIAPHNIENASVSNNNDYSEDAIQTEATTVSCSFANPTEETLIQGHIMDKTVAHSNEEIDMMVDEALENKKREADEPDEGPSNKQTKEILVKKGTNHLDVLPSDWVEITHQSGMPIYLHKTSRVCTLSRPYVLGPDSARNHEVPLSAVPCSNNIKSIELENQKPIEETVQENVSPKQSVDVLKLKSCSGKKKSFKKSQLQLPNNTKLITVPSKALENTDKTNQNVKKEWILNPNGKSYPEILNDYVKQTLRQQAISYAFTELENTDTRFACTVEIEDIKYGTGYGRNKKQAKAEAAKLAVEVLIPEIKDKMTADTPIDQDLLVFDEISVEDPRVAELCVKTSQPTPFQVLETSFRDNFGYEDVKIEIHCQNSSNYQGKEFTMTVGNYTATVVCDNKREGKQRASQAILQKLHPTITSWGSILKLYANGSAKSRRERKLYNREVNLLRSETVPNQPNFAILNKLRLELGKLNEKRKALQQPIAEPDTTTNSK